MSPEALRALEKDAARYRFLRGRELPTGSEGLRGVFIGIVPENAILTGADADTAVDSAMEGGVMGCVHIEYRPTKYVRGWPTKSLRPWLLYRDGKFVCAYSTRSAAEAASGAK